MAGRLAKWWDWDLLTTKIVNKSSTEAWLESDIDQLYSWVQLYGDWSKMYSTLTGRNKVVAPYKLLSLRKVEAFILFKVTVNSYI